MLLCCIMVLEMLLSTKTTLMSSLSAKAQNFLGQRALLNVTETGSTPTHRSRSSTTTLSSHRMGSRISLKFVSRPVSGTKSMLLVLKRYILHLRTYQLQFIEFTIIAPSKIGDHITFRSQFRRRPFDRLRPTEFIEMNTPVFETRFLFAFLTKEFDARLKGWGADIWYSHVCMLLSGQCRMGITDCVWSENPLRRENGNREINTVQSTKERFADWAEISKAKGLPLLVPDSSWNFFTEKYPINLGKSQYTGEILFLLLSVLILVRNLQENVQRNRHPCPLRWARQFACKQFQSRQ